MGTRIEWTEETWNPVVGCTKVSAGCENCYAERMARRLRGMALAKLRRDPQANDGTMKYLGVVDEHGWTGRIGVGGVDEWTQPLRWRKPRRVFVVSMGDLFHPRVPFDFVDRVFGVMALAERHTFQVLTKRPDRMRVYFETLADRAADTTALGRRSCAYEVGRVWEFWQAEVGRVWDGETRIDRQWPLSNVWLGATVENQKAADERIADLEVCPAVVHFLSVEPMLGRVDVREFLYDENRWVICGGESGPQARPMHPVWARDLRDQCVEAGVPFFFKQWGGLRRGRMLDGREWNEYPG